MLYMIIERFHERKLRSVYERLDEKGRMMPDGLTYVNSWVTEDLSICYQVIESITPEKVHEWTSHWNDLVDFEIIPVISSAEAKTKVLLNDK